MKNFLLLLTISLFLTSCGTAYYYQLFKTESLEDPKTVEKNIVFEDEVLDLVYDFWDENGNSSFLIYNKSDQDIYIDLGKSHLIINGYAKTYYQNRMFTESTSSSISIGSVYTTGSSVRTYRSSSYGNLYVYPNYVSGRSQTTSRTYTTGSSTTTASKATQSEGYAVTFHENRVITIPAKSGKIVDGFSLKYSPYRDCDLYRFPSKKEINKKNFTQENTPLKFKNIITYGFDEKEPNSITIEHNFWVSEIANYSKDQFFSYDNLEYCGQRLMHKANFYMYESPKNFYIEYQITMDTFEH